MKILLATPYFYPSIGGVQQYTLNLAKGLAEHGHEVVVATTAARGEKADVSETQGFRVHRLPYRAALSNTPLAPSWFWRLRHIVGDEQPDLVHAHAPVPGMADLAYAARSRVPFVLTYHAGRMRRSKTLNPLLHIYEQQVLKRVVRGANAIGAVYPPFIKTLAAANQAVQFAPGGIDVARFVPDDDIAKRTDVLYVGRMERSSAWKGVDVLLRAVAEAAKTQPGIHATFVGDGNAVDDYRQLAEELGISDNVHFAGALRDDALADAYREARTLVLPSKTEDESLGLVLVEAMASGVPVIGSRVGGIPNVITHNETGLLVAPNNPNELAAAIRRILNEPALAAKLRMAGRKRAVQTFSIEALTNRALALYEEALL